MERTHVNTPWRCAAEEMKRAATEERRGVKWEMKWGRDATTAAEKWLPGIKNRTENLCQSSVKILPISQCSLSSDHPSESTGKHHCGLDILPAGEPRSCDCCSLSLAACSQMTAWVSSWRWLQALPWWQQSGRQKPVDPEAQRSVAIVLFLTRRMLERPWPALFACSV